MLSDGNSKLRENNKKYLEMNLDQILTEGNLPNLKDF